MNQTKLFFFPTKQVTRLLGRVAPEQGTYSGVVRIDNRPDFISVKFKEWAEQQSSDCSLHTAWQAFSKRFFY